LMRRLASCLLMRSASESTLGQELAPSLVRALRGELMDQLVVHGPLAAITLFQPLLDREHFGCRQRREG
jgi:hypothetical protein